MKKYGAVDIRDVPSGNSLWQDGVRRFLKNRMAISGLIFLILLTICCIIAPWFSPYSYETQDLMSGATGPRFAHWFGTDMLGRDLLTRVLYGGRVSLLVGFCATIVSVIIGIVWGSIAGWAGGKTDSFMMRFVDIVYAFPFTIFVIILMVFLGRSLLLLFAAIGAVEWLTMSRIVRGQVISLKRQEFVEAAQCIGLSRSAILFRHILPNLLGPVIVYSSLTVPGVMLLEAFLSFLGLGVQPPMSSWGILIREGAEGMESYPWLLLFPGIILSCTRFVLNFIGDGLRDAFDPKSMRE
jgi:oligopeptide transport system permease protein